MLSIGNLAIQLTTTPLLLRKPCKLFASIAWVCQRQLGFLVFCRYVLSGYDWIPCRPRRPHFTGTYAGPLAKRHCTALRHMTNYRQVAGDAGVRTVAADVVFECPRCLGHRDNGTYDWSVPLRKLKNDQSPAASKRSTRSFGAVISTS